MGTEKRQRQKEGRQARIAAAEAERRHSLRRRRYINFIVIAVVVLGLFALISWLTNNHKSHKSASSTTTTADSSSTTLASAKGKKCVAMKGPPPKGAPTVEVQTGPPPTKLVIKDIKEGTGTAVAATDTVTVNYIGVACSTGKIFDSSWSRGQTATFALNQVIPGWTQGLVGMKPGGERLLGIPSSLGYGSAGQAPDIAPDEALWFVVDLVSTGPTTTTTTAAASTTTAAGAATTTTTAQAG